MLVACSSSGSNNGGAGPNGSLGPGNGDGDGGGGASGQDPDAPTTCQVTSFASSPADFALPNVDAEDSSFSMVAGSGQLTGVDEYLSWSTVDIDGDRIPDLVVTRRSSVPSVGLSKWQVFKGDGTRFAATPTDFALPDVGVTEAQSFSNLAGSGQLVGDDDYLSWTTIDIDGDKLLDLVVTQHSATDPSIGLENWQVYKGNGSRFAAKPTNFALPDVGATDAPFTRAAGSGVLVGDEDYLSWSTIDIDGDKLLDLVVTQHSTTNPSVGLEKWQVFKGNGSRFAANATDFALPDVGATDAPFTRTAASGVLVGEEDYLSWSTIDIDGDKLLDLVVTQHSATAPSTGLAKWQVFKGNGSRFAAKATDFALPDIGATEDYPSFTDVAGNGQLVGPEDYLSWSTLDIDGDRIVDLVVTRRSKTPGVGLSKWLVFRGNGSGFAAKSTDFPLPDVGASETYPSFTSTAGNGQPISSNEDYLAWSTLELTNDGKLDLVVTSSPSSGVGLTKWLVFHGRCDGE
jgi:hypothetical protein